MSNVELILYRDVDDMSTFSVAHGCSGNAVGESGTIVNDGDKETLTFLFHG